MPLTRITGLQMGGWKERRMDGWIDKWRFGWMDGWIDTRIDDIYNCIFLPFNYIIVLLSLINDLA